MRFSSDYNGLGGAVLLSAAYDSNVQMEKKGGIACERKIPIDKLISPGWSR